MIATSCARERSGVRSATTLTPCRSRRRSSADGGRTSKNSGRRSAADFSRSLRKKAAASGSLSLGSAMRFPSVAAVGALYRGVRRVRLGGNASLSYSCRIGI